MSEKSVHATYLLCALLAALCLMGAANAAEAPAAYQADADAVEAILPENLTHLEAYAFYRCEALARIALPRSLRSIGEYAFFGCAALKDLYVPQSVTSIGAHAFDACGEDFVLRGGAGSYVERYAEENGIAFARTEVEILRQPQNTAVVPGNTARVSIEATGEGLMYQWWYAIGDADFAKVLDSQSTYTMAATSGMEDIRLYCVITDTYGNSIRSNEAVIHVVEGLRFQHADEGVTITGYTGQDADLVIPDRIGDLAVVCIGYNAFSNCEILHSVVLPEGVKSIAHGAFYNCGI